MVLGLIRHGARLEGNFLQNESPRYGDVCSESGTLTLTLRFTPRYAPTGPWWCDDSPTG